MKKVTRLLLHSVALPFYRKHAGMFLFLFFLLFGIQPTAHEAIQTHYYLIRLILTSNYFFLFTLVIWLIYLAKGILFLKSCLQQKAYNFLFHINTIPTLKRYVFLFRLTIILLGPITCYGILIIIVAVKDQFVFGGILVVVAILLLHLLMSLIALYVLKNAKGIQEMSKPILSFPFPKTFFGFVLKAIFRKQFVTLFIVKLVSFTCLYFFTTIENYFF